MHPSHEQPTQLLTASQVQEMLNIDRSTVYRMAEDGRLPAIRVGRSWRFPAARIRVLLGEGPQGAEESAGRGVDRSSGPSGTAAASVGSRDLGDGGTGSSPVAATLLQCVAQAAIDVAADLLGVMMVVTDMHGKPITEVANPCPWFSENANDPEVLDSCLSEWRILADNPDLTVAFRTGEVGFQCARTFIRSGNSLVGMVLAGGISPEGNATIDTGLYHLDPASRQRVLAALPRIAAAISTQAPRRSDADRTGEP